MHDSATLHGGLVDGPFVLEQMFRGVHGFDANGRIVSDLVPTGVLPACLPQLHEHGVNLPDQVLELAQRQPAAGAPRNARH